MLYMICCHMSLKISLFCGFIVTFSTWIFYTFMNRRHMYFKMCLTWCLIVTFRTWVFYTFMTWFIMCIEMGLPTIAFITFLTVKLFVCNCWNYILTPRLIIILCYHFPRWIVTSFITFVDKVLNFWLIRQIVSIVCCLMFPFSNSFSFWRWDNILRSWFWGKFSIWNNALSICFRETSDI